MITRRIILALAAVVTLALAGEVQAGPRVFIGFGSPYYYHRPYGGVRVVVGVPPIYIGPAPTYYYVPASPPVYVVPQPAPIYIPAPTTAAPRQSVGSAPEQVPAPLPTLPPPPPSPAK